VLSKNVICANSKIALGFFLVVSLTTSGGAQELSYSFGRSSADLGTSYSWQIDYRQHFLRYFAWSAAWINEGHIPDHHRDGYTSELWAEAPLFQRKMAVAAGGGFYRFYDTQPTPDRTDSLNVHGWAPIASLSATYYTKTPWFLRLTVNWLLPHDDIQTRTAVLGVGYQLWQTAEDKAGSPEEPQEKPIMRTTTNEVTLSLGKSVVNTLNSQSGVASSLEFRKGFARYGDWSVSFINEGDAEIIKRAGFAGQVWLTDVFLNQKLTVAFGAGPYVFIDRDQSESRSDVTGMVTPSVSWRFNDHWLARLNWNRVITGYNRDADLFLLGLGYRWGV